MTMVPTTLFVSAVAILTAAAFPNSGEEDDEVWIGVLGIPASGGCDSLESAVVDSVGGSSCFANFYDKWVQSAGARVVGIPFDALDLNRTLLDGLLSSLNGVLFSGGGLNLLDTSSAYHRTGRYILDWVIRTNDLGVSFPLRGHCMGFQFLTILVAGDNTTVLQTNSFDSEGISLPLELLDAKNESRWLARMPPSIRRTFFTQQSTTNFHHDGVTPTTFFHNPRLSSFFRGITKNRDLKGREFMSTIESRRYPIFAVQWHPEKNQFEWTRNINHSADAVAANGWMASDFISEARKNRPQRRDMRLLRQLTTLAMRQMPSEDLLIGKAFLMFKGFEGSNPTTSTLLV